MSRQRMARVVGSPVVSRLLESTARRLGSGRLVVLMYHYFEGASGDPLVVLRDAFRRQIEHLVRHYSVVRLGEALAAWSGGSPPPARSVALTIDDVGHDFVEVAWPVLQEFGVPATVAVCPGFAGDDAHARRFGILHGWLRTSPAFREGLQRALGRSALEYADAFDALYRLEAGELDGIFRKLAPPEDHVPGGLRLPVATLATLREMAATGLLEVASHTMTHPVLSRISGDWLSWELEEARRRIEDRIGECSLLFYPGGARPAIESGGAGLAKHGYRHAFGIVPGLCDGTQDPSALPRIAVPGGEPFGMFRVRTSGWPALMGRLRH